MHAPVQRLRHQQITPLELADVWVNGVTLWEWLWCRDFPVALGQGLQILHAGNGRVAGQEPVPATIAGFDAAFLAGGRAANGELHDSLSGLPFAVLFAPDPVQAGTRGGLDWLRTHDLAGWVADLGNSQLKIAAPGRQWVFSRDWTRLRSPDRVSPTELPAQCRRLREFIAFGLQSAMAESGQRPEALLFALPARLNEDGTPSSSSYTGMANDRKLLPDALALAGLAQTSLYVLNDAELAALGALSYAPLAAFRKVLVLTLGFGIGAALICRSGN